MRVGPTGKSMHRYDSQRRECDVTSIRSQLVDEENTQLISDTKN